MERGALWRPSAHHRHLLDGSSKLDSSTSTPSSGAGPRRGGPAIGGRAGAPGLSSARDAGEQLAERERVDGLEPAPDDGRRGYSKKGVSSCDVGLGTGRRPHPARRRSSHPSSRAPAPHHCQRLGARRFTGRPHEWDRFPGVTFSLVSVALHGFREDFLASQGRGERHESALTMVRAGERLSGLAMQRGDMGGASASGRRGHGRAARAGWAPPPL